MSDATPAGYVHVTSGRCRVVTLAALAEDARRLLTEGTLYEAAARDLGARPLDGRGIAYAIVLPASRTPVVVRHNRHGGLFASVTRDLFLPPTRAPNELVTSLRLAAAGVRTPTVLMYGVERVAALFRRADVVTQLVDESRDLATYLLPGEPAESRAAAWRATRELVATLDAGNARHHDLNVKNVLLARCEGALSAWVLDVDRVEFTSAAAARAGNAARLLQSARKWRDQRGGELHEARDVPWLLHEGRASG